MTYAAEAQQHYGPVEWDLEGPAEWAATLAYGVRLQVVALDYQHPQGEYSAAVYWHMEDATECGVYRTLAEAQHAAYGAVIVDYAEYLAIYGQGAR